MKAYEFDVPETCPNGHPAWTADSEGRGICSNSNMDTGDDPNSAALPCEFYESLF